LIDSHAHIGEAVFDEDRAAMMLRAADAGVEDVVAIGYDLPSSQRVVDLVGSQDGGVPHLWATAGFAPHNVADASAEGMSRVRDLLSAPGVVAVGEIGLDYHYDMPRDLQRRVFAEQLGWAVQAGLPVVVHSREAEDDVVGLLRQHGAGDRLRGVIHCFTESAAMARAVVDLGFYVGLSGILTFKNAADLRATATQVPLSQTLIETDAPYLAPVPYRGKRNEPSFVGAVAECLAGIHGVAADEVAAITAANARRLFQLPAPRTGP